MVTTLGHARSILATGAAFSTTRKRVVRTEITRLRVVLFSEHTATTFPRPMNNHRQQATGIDQRPD